MDSRSWPGGSIKVREIISDHPSETAYDFRSRFGVSYLEIGRSVTYLEAAHLISILVQQSDSWLCSALAKWKYPVTNEWTVLVNTYDLLAQINSKKKPKPYPRPWKSNGASKLGGTGQPRSEVIDRLNQMNNRKLEE